MASVIAGRYYMWRGHGVLALNPSQWCRMGFEVALCRYVGESIKFYAPAQELKPIKPPVQAAQPAESPLVQIHTLRKKGRSYKEIAHNLNVQGLKTPEGMDWSGARVRSFVHYREKTRVED